MLGDEFESMIGEIVDDEPVALDDSTILLKRRTEVVAPMAGAESVEFVESPAVGVVGVLHAVMPLSESGRGVASVLERFCDGRFVEVESLTARRGAVDAAAEMVAASQEFCSSR